MDQNKQPKHMLAVISLLLAIIAIVFSIFCYNILTDSLDSNNDDALAPAAIAFFGSIVAIISSVIAKKNKNEEIYSTLGMIIAFIAIVIILGMVMTIK